MVARHRFVIKEMYAIVAENEEGEGMVGMPTPGGMMPLVAAERTRVNQMKEVAEAVKAEHGIEYKILKFTTREDVTDEF